MLSIKLLGTFYVGKTPVCKHRGMGHFRSRGEHVQPTCPVMPLVNNGSLTSMCSPYLPLTIIWEADLKNAKRSPVETAISSFWILEQIILVEPQKLQEFFSLS